MALALRPHDLDRWHFRVPGQGRHLWCLCDRWGALHVANHAYWSW